MVRGGRVHRKRTPIQYSNHLSRIEGEVQDLHLDVVNGMISIVRIHNMTLKLYY